MTHRGVAMLVVLAVLVVAVASATNIARVAVTGLAARDAGRDARLADELLVQAERAAVSWLIRSSGRVVLPPDTDRPSLTILDDTFELGGHEARVTIVAVDLQGMPDVGGLGPFRHTIPHDVLEIIDACEAGADLLAPDMIGPLKSERPVYPAAPDRAERSGGRAPVSVCEAVAFARPTPARRVGLGRTAAVPTVLHLNTAPLPLVEAALALTGIDAISEIVEAREAGRSVALDVDLDAASPVRFVTRGTLWGFQCDTRFGAVHASRWIVFEEAAGAWRLIRRIVIDG